jgi:hypothetical protein
LHPEKTASSIPRRSLVAAGIAGAVGIAFPRLALAATTILMPAAGGNRRFVVLYQEEQIGIHTVSYSTAIKETLVTTEINLLIKTAGFTSYALRHRSEETWRAGRLVSLTSDTVENGAPHHVEGTATPQGFLVASKDGLFTAAPTTLTSNGLWTPALLEQSTLVDAHHGGIVEISAHKFPGEEITIAGHRIAATRYTFTTQYLAGSIWYDMKNLWVRGEFEHDGTRIRYILDA